MDTQTGVFYNSKGEPRPYRLAFPDTPNKSKKQTPLAIFAHGFGGSYDSNYIVSNVPHFLNAGVATMTFNFCNPHTDKICTKKLTPEKALDDLTSGIRFISQDARMDKNNMLGVAASFGAYTMMRYAANDKNPPLKGMVLYSAVPDPIAPFKKELNYAKEWLWRLKGHTDVDVDGTTCPISYQCYEEAKSIDLYREAAPFITCPVVNIHGTDDKLASVNSIVSLHDAMTAAPKKDLHILDGAEHAFALDRRHPDVASPMEQAVALTQVEIGMMLHENGRQVTAAQQMLFGVLVGYEERVKRAFGFDPATAARVALRV